MIMVAVEDRVIYIYWAHFLFMVSDIVEGCKIHLMIHIVLTIIA